MNIRLNNFQDVRSWIGLRVESLRLICVDTPEKGGDGYEEATGYLESLVLDKEVRMEKDVSDKDKYGRLLRYVYVNSSVSSDEGYEDEIFVNKEIVQEGYGEVFEYGEDVKRCGEIGGTKLLSKT